MLLSEFKERLNQVAEVTFLKPDGTTIPSHFHITEVGQVNKRFIDCGGNVRNENVISMQLWDSEDFWHRLEPNKLISIIDLSIERLNIQNLEIEIEYQSETIGKYGVQFDDGIFILTTTKTDCLASDKCGIKPISIVKENPKDSCSPSSGCC
jgi:hypothetical protein